MSAAPALAARFAAPSVRIAMGAKIAPLLSSIAEHRLAVAASLAAHLSEAELQTMLTRINSDRDPIRTARNLGILAGVRPELRAQLIRMAADRLSEHGEAHAAAIWAAEHEGALDPLSAAPLLELQKRSSTERGWFPLTTALYRFVAESEKRKLESALISERPLTPSFVAALDYSSFPESMRTALDICRFGGGREGPSAHAGILENASLFLAADEKVLRAVLEHHPAAECALIALDLLRSATTLGIRDQSRVLLRLTPLMSQILGARGCSEVAASVAHMAALYGGARSRQSAVSSRPKGR